MQSRDRRNSLSNNLVILIRNFIIIMNMLFIEVNLMFDNNVCLISLAMFPLTKFETAATSDDNSVSQCSAEGKCAPDEDGE